MAQFAGEPQLSTTLEGISTLVPPTLALTPSIPLVTPGFHPLVSGTPLHLARLGQAYAPPDPVIEATLVTTTRIPETVPIGTDPQGYIIYGTSSATATSTVGSLLPGQFVSLPLGSGPSPTLHLSIPIDRPLDVRYQHLMKLAQLFWGMALSIRPSVDPVAPEVPL